MDPFTNGQESSASQLMSQLQTIRQMGQSVLDELTTIQSSTLLTFQRRLNVINGKKVRTATTYSSNVLAAFDVTSFNYIDQSETTSEVHIDAADVTLPERLIYETPSTNDITFTTSVGNIQVIDDNYSLYQVYQTSGQIPVGTFLITLQQAVDLSIISFDLSSLSSIPSVSIQVSATGITYFPVTNISLSGYNMIAYCNLQSVAYIQVVITPSQPDNLGGNTYTFGLTDFAVRGSQFELASDFVTRPITIKPSSANCYLDTTTIDGITYYVSFDGITFLQVVPGTSFAIPSVTSVTLTGIALNGSGQLLTTLPSDIYTNTLTVADSGTGNLYPILTNLSGSDPNIAKIRNTYISISGDNLLFIPYSSGDSSKTFNINYLTGPSTLQATLKIHLQSVSNTVSPIFQGATLVQG